MFVSWKKLVIVLKFSNIDLTYIIFNKYTFMHLCSKLQKVSKFTTKLSYKIGLETFEALPSTYFLLKSVSGKLS